MPTPTSFTIRVTPHLRVRNTAKAIEFYRQAFGAVEVGRYTDPEGVIAYAGLSIGDAKLSLAEESPGSGSPSPQTVGHTTICIDLIVPNVDEMVNRAVALGAKIQFPVENQFYGIRQGRIVDPFGHQWSIGSPLEGA